MKKILVDARFILLMFLSVFISVCAFVGLAFAAAKPNVKNNFTISTTEEYAELPSFYDLNGLIKGGEGTFTTDDTNVESITFDYYDEDGGYTLPSGDKIDLNTAEPLTEEINLYRVENDNSKVDVYILSSEEIFASDEFVKEFSMGSTTSGVPQASPFNKFNSLTSLKFKNFNTKHLHIAPVGYGMFSECKLLTELDLSGWDVSNFTNFRGMFNGCTNLRTLNLDGWDFSNAVNFAYMFDGCSNLQSINLKDWNTSNVIDFAYMFYGCSSLTSLDLTGWDVSKAITMDDMFSGCSSLQTLNLSGWDTSEVTIFSYMFNGCSGLQNLELKEWNTNNATMFVSMFSGCTGLENLDLSGWDTSQITSFVNMFKGCTSLQTLNLGGWDTSSATNTDSMFSGCSNLTNIYVGDGWNVSSLSNTSNMFLDCTLLEGETGTAYSAESVDGTMATTNGYLWTAPKYDINYQFKFSDGDAVSVQNPNPVVHYGNPNFKLQQPSAEGWYFAGWFEDDAYETPITVVDKEIKEELTIYGLFEKNVSYIFKFLNPNGEQIVSTQSILLEDVPEDIGTLYNEIVTDAGGELYFEWKLEGGNWCFDQDLQETYSLDALKQKYPGGVNQEVNLYASMKQKFQLEISNELYGAPASVGVFSIIIVQNVDETICETTFSDLGIIDFYIEDGAHVWLYTNTGLAQMNDIPDLNENATIIEFIMPAENVSGTIVAACVVEGTLITLADGTQKKVENLTTSDKVLIFNHETGKYEAGTVWFIHCDKDAAHDYEIVNLEFDDGSTTRIVYSHAFFDLDLNKYVYITAANYKQYIGHRFSAVRGGENGYEEYAMTLVNSYLTYEHVRVFSPVSLYHVNVVTNNLLSVSAFPDGIEGFVNFFAYDESKKYDEEKMKEDIERFGLFTYDDFEKYKQYMTKEEFDATPIKYYKIAIGKGLLQYKDLDTLFKFLLDNHILS